MLRRSENAAHAEAGQSDLAGGVTDSDSLAREHRERTQRARGGRENLFELDSGLLHSHGLGTIRQRFHDRIARSFNLDIEEQRAGRYC